MLQTFLDLLARADDETLMMSMMDCHAPNLSSIVVKNEDGRLTRAFLAWPGNPMHRNTLNQDLPLGIHNHRYSLTLHWMHGEVVNTLYDEDGWCELNKFRYTSAMAVDGPKFESLGMARLGVTMDTTLGPGMVCYMSAETLHDVRCGEIAAWLVEEGPVEQEQTLLFSPSTIDMAGLYTPFYSPEYVRAHVKQWLELALSSKPG